MATNSGFFFRDDMEAEKQRKADGFPTATVNPTVTAPPPAQNLAPPPQDNAFKNLATTANSIKPATEKPDYFADFRATLDAQDPFKQQAKNAISETFKNPTAAFDAAANAQVDRVGREQAAQQEQQRQQAVMRFGGNQTGQVDKAMRSFGNQAIMQQAELGRDITAGRAQAAEAARGNAINQSVAMLGEERAAAGQLAGLGLQKEGLGLENEKFKAADANAKRGLTLEESAQELQRMGMSKEDARFYAGLASGEKMEAAKIASTEKVSFAKIGSDEKMQSSQQAWEGTQNELNRSLEKLLSNDKISAQFKLAEMDERLKLSMQEKGFVQDKELELMREDLQKTLQARGIDADTAKQVADQKFTEMMAGKEQAFQVQMNDIKQKFVTGERIDSQTWEKAMQAGEMKHDEDMAKLGSILRLDEAKNAQAFQVSFQNMQNDFSSLMQDRGFTHEEAMQTATQNFQTELQKLGFTHDEAMQSTEISARALENQLNRASQEMMATAQLAQSDKQFRQELEQRYQFNQSDLEIRKKELDATLKNLGLEGDRLTAALQNDKIKNAMDIAAIGMEIGDGSPESMAPFVEQFGSALSGYMKAQGVDISKSDFVKAMTAKPSTGAAPIVRDETGKIPDGTKVAGVDLSTLTAERMKSLASDPLKMDELIKSNAVKDIKTFDNMVAFEDGKKAIEKAGLKDSIKEESGNKITFKPNTYIYFNGKPYELTSYNSEVQGGGTWSDKSRNGLLKGIDWETGKEVVIKRDRRNLTAVGW